MIGVVHFKWVVDALLFTLGVVPEVLPLLISSLSSHHDERRLAYYLITNPPRSLYGSVGCYTLVLLSDVFHRSAAPVQHIAYWGAMSIPVRSEYS